MIKINNTMAKNQKLFNKEYPKKIKEIEIEDEDFEGRLVIENYPNLERLYLRDIESIDKVTLKNLPWLQQFTIWNCGLQDLMIESCPQIKKLNVRSNSLVSLEFLANLENLEKLEVDYNNEIDSDPKLLPKNLKFLSCENTKLEPFQKLFELTKQNPYGLAKKFWDLKEENKKLRKKIEEYSNSPQPLLNRPIDFEEKYQKLKETINSLLKEEQKKTDEIKPLEEAAATSVIITDELIERLKEQKENLSYLEKANWELKEKFAPFEQVYWKIEKKEKELKELKGNIITINHLEDEIDLDELNEVLEKQKMATKNDNEESVVKKLELVKKRILRAKVVSKEEINDLCKLQSQITQLQKNFNQREEQINQVINNYSIAGNAIINSTVGDNADLKTITYQSAVSSSNQTIAGSSSQKAQIEQKPNKWLSWRDKP